MHCVCPREEERRGEEMEVERGSRKREAERGGKRETPIWCCETSHVTVPFLYPCCHTVFLLSHCIFDACCYSIFVVVTTVLLLFVILYPYCCYTVFLLLHCSFIVTTLYFRCHPIFVIVTLYLCCCYTVSCCALCVVLYHS